MTCSRDHCVAEDLHANAWAPGRCWAHLGAAEKKALRSLLVAGAAVPLTPLQNPVLDDFDFSGRSLEGLEIVGGVLRRAQFRGALLREVTFCGTDLSAADFAGARLEGVRFVGVIAARIDFERAQLKNCSFLGLEDKPSNLRQANFHRATLEDVSFWPGTCLEESAFSVAALYRAALLRCEATNADFQNLRCEGTRILGGVFDHVFFNDAVFAPGSGGPLFEDTSLQGCDFRRASVEPDAAAASDFLVCKMVNSDFSASQLDRARFVRCDATSCSFENAGLDGTSFIESTLVAAVFSSTRLLGTRFERVNLGSARFDQSVLQRARLTKVEGLAVVFGAAYLSRCRFEECDLRSASGPQAIFEGCWLTKVKLMDALLPGVRFSACRLADVLLVDANLQGSLFDGSQRRPGAEVNLTGADLSNADLRSEQLGGWNFTRTVFEDAWLRWAVLDRARFDEARLSLCDLRQVRAKGVTFRNARLVDCRLEGAVFIHCGFSGADLSGITTISPSLLIGAARGKGAVAGTPGEVRVTARARTYFVERCDFSDGVLRNATLVGANLENSDLRRSVVAGCDLRAANLRSVKADAASFEGSRFGTPDDQQPGQPRRPEAEGDPLPSALFAHADLSGISAVRASFRDASLVGCRLQGANLRNARLDNADLSGADVTDATFSGATLIGVNGIRRLLIGAGRPPDFSYAYIQGTQGPLEEPAGQLAQGEVGWAEFCAWINGGRGSDPDVRRLSWVAWKNNYQSLGLYSEESECFREEKIAGGWEGLHRSPWRWLARGGALFAVAIVVVICGLVYSAAREVLGARAQWAGIAAMGAVVAALAIRRGSGPRARRLGLLVSDLVYGFGERPRWILLNAVFVIVVFALAYNRAQFWTWGSGGERPWGGFVHGKGTPNLMLGECFYFSVVTFTTVGYGDIEPLEYCRFLASCESLLGLVMAALFIHCIARRTAGR